MNRIAAGLCLSALLLASPVLAKPKHPNINAAHNAIKNAIVKLTAAQVANEYDMQGHAAKAKELLEQAEKEVAQAREAADEAKK